MNLLSKNIFSTDKAHGWVPWGVLAPILALLFIVVPLITIDRTVFLPLGLTDENLSPVGEYGLLAYLTISFAAVGLVIGLWVLFVEKRSLATIGLLPEMGAKTFMRGFGFGTLMVSALVISIWIFGGYETGALFPAFGSTLSIFHIILFMIGFSIQSGVEEIVFRGWLLSVVTRKFNLLTAVILSSLLFTLMHYDSSAAWHNTLISFLFSLFACAWVIQTNSVWGAMGWHAGWNWFMAVGFEVPITGVDTGTPALIIELIPSGDTLLTGGDVGPEGSWLCATVFVIATAIIIFKRNSQQEK